MKYTAHENAFITHGQATEHVFQQCSDIGALGFIVPTVLSRPPPARR
jgi:hypothetical protein